jgi:hypothetical protein
MTKLEFYTAWREGVPHADVGPLCWALPNCREPEHVTLTCGYGIRGDGTLMLAVERGELVAGWAGA